MVQYEDTETTTLEGRVAALERTLSALGGEVRTRRLVVVDAGGDERIVGRVADGTAELRVAQAGSEGRERTAVLVFVNPGHEPYDLPSGIGLQLWVRGDVVGEVSHWDDGDAGEE